MLFLSGMAFMIVVIFMRLLRRNIEENRNFFGSQTLARNFAAASLQHRDPATQAAEKRTRGRLSRRPSSAAPAPANNFSQAVLANLSCGVLVFGTNGLVTQSNPAAKQILGFASSTGMGADDLFRGEIAAEVHSVLRESSGLRQLETDYATPSGEKRHIAVTVSPCPHSMAACSAQPASSMI